MEKSIYIFLFLTIPMLSFGQLGDYTKGTQGIVDIVSFSDTLTTIATKEDIAAGASDGVVTGITINSATQTADLQTANPAADVLNQDLSVLTFDTELLDNDATNEIQDLTLTLNTLSLTNDGTTVDLSGYLDNTDAQTSSWVDGTNTLNLTGGNSTVITGFADDTHTHTESDITDLTHLQIGTLATEALAGNTVTITTAQANEITANTLKVASDDDFSDNTTTDLVEGTNLYYTDARVIANATVAANTTKNTYPSADATKLSGIEALAEVNVQADWNEANAASDAFILNKPSSLHDPVTLGVGNNSKLTLSSQELVLTDVDDADANPNNEIQTASWDNVNNDLTLSGSNTIQITGYADSAAVAAIDATLDDFSDNTTTDLAEGINQYYTEARVTANASVTANTAKVSADDSVVTHSDVTNAGSGIIIGDAERTKLTGIETAATADQTGAEIKALYEAEANTNAYVDADKTKVDFISVTGAIDLDALDASNHPALTINATNDAGGRLTVNASQEISLTDYVETQTLANVTALGSSFGSNVDATGLTSSPASTSSATSKAYVDAEIITSANLDLDKDSTNELQTLSLVGLNLLLDDSDGVTQNTIDFSDLQDVTTNVGSVISMAAAPTGAAIVGSPTVNYTRTKDSAGGYVTECWGTFQVNVTSNAGSQFTVIVNTSYSASFTTTDQVKGSVYCYSSGGTPLRILPSADTGNDEINLVFDTTVTGVHDLGFNLSFKN